MSSNDIDLDAEVADRAARLRVLRELEAAKARVERDAERVHAEIRQKLVSELLPVLDNVDRAIAVAVSNGDAPAVVDGVRMVRAHFERVLRGYGLARFEAIGTTFDPRVHEAVYITPVDEPERDLLVIEQLVPGYLLSDRLMRAAKVVVGRYGSPVTPLRDERDR